MRIKGCNGSIRVGELNMQRFGNVLSETGGWIYKKPATKAGAEQRWALLVLVLLVVVIVFLELLVLVLLLVLLVFYYDYY